MARPMPSPSICKRQHPARTKKPTLNEIKQGWELHSQPCSFRNDIDLLADLFQYQRTGITINGFKDYIFGAIVMAKY